MIDLPQDFLMRTREGVLGKITGLPKCQSQNYDIWKFFHESRNQPHADNLDMALRK